MKTPEDVAREVWQAVADSIHRNDQSAVDAMAEVIHDYAKEVAETQRQITLVSFEWETTPGPVGTHRGPARRLVGPWEPGERTPEPAKPGDNQ